jgi:hypothetical protein
MLPLDAGFGTRGPTQSSIVQTLERMFALHKAKLQEW